jgi:signal transduction histidine kinase
MNSGTWQVTLLMFSFMTILMPHLYQTVFVENTRPDELNKASWGVSLYLLPIAFVTPIIMWAAMYQGFTDRPDDMLQRVVLSLHSPLMLVLFFIAALSAVCSSMMVGLLALSSMVFNHLVIGFYKPRHQRHTLESYIRLRKLMLLILLSILSVLLFVLVRDQSFEILGASVFSGFQVLLPALIGVLFWPRANRIGCLCSIILGAVAWLLLQLLPFHTDVFGNHVGSRTFLSFKQEWLGLVSIGLSLLGLVVGSLLTKQSSSEQGRALECAVYDPEPILRVQRWDISATCVTEVEQALSQQLGRRIALQQVRLALNTLGMTRQEIRPEWLTRLREQLNYNLSALLGPAAAQDMLDQALPYQARIDMPQIVMRHSLEQQLDRQHEKSRLSGTAAELDALRRFHRQTLHELPIGVCSIDALQTIMGWNRAMSDMTGFNDEVIGWQLADLPAPWGPLLTRFMDQHEHQLYRQTVERYGRRYLVNLQRASLGDPEQQHQVLVVEDVTQVAELEIQVSHQDRLAAIGRLVAGVAHEIGNPVTGIAGLAQNLEADFDDPEIHEASTQILEQTQRIRHIVSALVGYARTDRLDQTQRQMLCLRDLVEESMSLSRMGQRRRIHFINTVDAELYVSGYGPQLHQVFINLFSNAIDASPDAPAGSLGIRIHVSAHRNGQNTHIEIEDDGTGLPDGELRAKLFEPFVTTKQYGQGTGLGLSLVQGIISTHGGRIQLMDKTDYDQGQGVIVQLTLPAADLPVEHP